MAGPPRDPGLGRGAGRRPRAGRAPVGAPSWRPRPARPTCAATPRPPSAWPAEAWSGPATMTRGLNLRALALALLTRGEFAEVIDIEVVAAPLGPGPTAASGSPRSPRPTPAIRPGPASFALMTAGDVPSLLGPRRLRRRGDRQRGGPPDAAERRYTRAIELARASGATFVVNIASVGLLTVLTRSGRTGDALAATARSSTTRPPGNWSHLWTTLRNLADLLRALDDPAPAALLDATTDPVPDGHDDRGRGPGARPGHRGPRAGPRAPPGPPIARHLQDMTARSAPLDSAPRSRQRPARRRRGEPADLSAPTTIQSIHTPTTSPPSAPCLGSRPQPRRRALPLQQRPRRAGRRRRQSSWSPPPAASTAATTRPLRSPARLAAAASRRSRQPLQPQTRPAPHRAPSSSSTRAGAAISTARSSRPAARTRVHRARRDRGRGSRPTR